MISSIFRALGGGGKNAESNHEEFAVAALQMSYFWSQTLNIAS